MKFHQAEALILSVTDLQEADRIVEFLTRDLGKRRGVARGAKRRYSRFAGELQPLARARIEWFEKERRDLVRISAVELSRAPKALTADLESILLGAYLAEQGAVFAQEGEPAELLFRLLDTTVEELERGADRDLAARYVETWVLRLAGIFPAPSECPECARPLRGGAALAASGEALLCQTCGGAAATQVSAGAIELLRRIARESLRQLAERPPERIALGEVASIAGRVRRHFLQHELKSYVVLERTLASLKESR